MFTPLESFLFGVQETEEVKKDAEAWQLGRQLQPFGLRRLSRFGDVHIDLGDTNKYTKTTTLEAMYRMRCGEFGNRDELL